MGNQDYTNLNGDDIGGKVLFGGLCTSASNPTTKYKYLVNHFSDGHIGNSWHTFGLIWKPGKLLWGLYITKKILSFDRLL